MIGAFFVSADNAAVFWYCVFGYAAFKTLAVYILSMFRKSEIAFQIDKEVERRLIQMAYDARLQLARGDPAPIVYHGG